MSLSISVSTLDSSADIESRVLLALRALVSNVLLGAAPDIRGRVQGLCRGLIEGTDEYQSLLSGELLAELGVPDVERRLHQILETIAGSVDVSVRPVIVRGGRLQGGMDISILRSGFEDILGLSAADYVSNGRYLIPWLGWLLLEGDRIIVLTHEITYNLSDADRIRSRTGLALMRPGSGWRVPSWASGVRDDNFLTRAFDAPAVGERIAQVIEEEIQKRL